MIDAAFYPYVKKSKELRVAVKLDDNTRVRGQTVGKGSRLHDP